MNEYLTDHPKNAKVKEFTDMAIQGISHPNYESVQDEGPGLTEQDQKNLFKGFQKLSTKPTAGESSTGLGLAIVKKMVEAHDGQLKVESSPGKGSTFSFGVPLSGPSEKTVSEKKNENEMAVQS